MEVYSLEISEWCHLATFNNGKDQLEVKIPKYGSITVGEFELSDKVKTKVDWVRLGLQRPESSVSTLYTGEELETLIKRLPFSAVEKGYQFMMNELMSWQEMPSEDSPKKDQTGGSSTSSSTTTSPTSLDSYSGNSNYVP